jgi:GT2 family glycosyltransferase
MTSVSIVIPTRDRLDRLRALLDSIGEAEEIVVVADGPTQGLEEALAGRDVSLVRHAASRGPAAARNSGWKAASGEWILFIDDDCVAAPGWLEAMGAATAADTVVQGRVEPNPDEIDALGPFDRTLSVSSAGPFFQTANILYPRALLEQLDGFDETFVHAGEDTDLGWRAKEAGASTRYEPQALAWHAVHKMGARGLVRNSRRWASAVLNVKRHPELRAHCHHEVFWKPSHEVLLLALTSTLLARRTRGASLVLTLPWLVHHRGEHRGRLAFVTQLPRHLAVDGAEMVAMVRGSIAARTLLL